MWRGNCMPDAIKLSYASVFFTDTDACPSSAAVTSLISVIYLSSMAPIGRSRLALCFDKGRHCAERRLFFCGGGGRRAARGSGTSCSRRATMS